MSTASDYFAAPGSGRAPTARGHFLELERDVEPVTVRPGLVFRPALGEATMLTSVQFAPNTEAPLHAHDEEQITLVVSGLLNFEIDGELRAMTPGMVAVVPANVPHRALSGPQGCLEYDVFNPPRQALLALARRVEPGDQA